MPWQTGIFEHRDLSLKIQNGGHLLKTKPCSLLTGYFRISGGDLGVRALLQVSMNPMSRLVKKGQNQRRPRTFRFF